MYSCFYVYLGISQLIYVLKYIVQVEQSQMCAFYVTAINDEIMRILTYIIYTITCVSTSAHTITVFQRHGCLLALCEVLTIIYQYMPELLLYTPVHTSAHTNTASTQLLPMTIIDSIIAVIPTIERNRGYRGRGNEMMREASMKLIQVMSQCNLHTCSANMIQYQISLLECINSNLCQPHEAIQLSAMKALRSFVFTYMSTNTTITNTHNISMNKLYELTVYKYISSINRVINSNIYTKNSSIFTVMQQVENKDTITEGVKDSDTIAQKRGYAMALGVLPIDLLLYTNTAKSDATTNSTTNTNTSNNNPLCVDLHPSIIHYIHNTIHTTTNTANTNTNWNHTLHILLFIITHSLCKYNCISGGETDAEFRKYLLYSVVEILEKLEYYMYGYNYKHMCDISCDSDSDNKQLDIVSVCTHMLHIFQIACDDYSTDKRGDTGIYIYICIYIYIYIFIL